MWSTRPIGQKTFAEWTKHETPSKKPITIRCVHAMSCLLWQSNTLQLPAAYLLNLLNGFPFTINQYIRKRHCIPPGSYWNSIFCICMHMLYWQQPAKTLIPKPWIYKPPHSKPLHMAKQWRIYYHVYSYVYIYIVLTICLVCGSLPPYFRSLQWRCPRQVFFDPDPVNQAQWRRTHSMPTGEKLWAKWPGNTRVKNTC